MLRITSLQSSSQYRPFSLSMNMRMGLQSFLCRNCAIMTNRNMIHRRKLLKVASIQYLHSNQSSSNPMLTRKDVAIEKMKKRSFSDMLAEHGPIFAVYWTTTWLLTGGALYVGIDSLGSDCAIDMARNIGVGNMVDLDNINPQYGNIALVVALNEALEVVRLPLVVSTTPMLTRFFANRGIIKGGPSRFQHLLKEHGTFFLGYWSVVWAVTGITTYLTLSILGPEVAFDAIRFIHADRYFDLSSWSPSSGNMALALLINEAFEPIRLPLVLASLTKVKRVLGFSK